MRLPGSINQLYAVFERILLNPDYGMRPTDDDCFIAVTGGTGTGKSNLVLLLFEYWYAKLMQEELTPELFEFFASNMPEFVYAISQSKKDYMVVHDEAIRDLHRKKGTSSKNIDLYQTFNIIRGKRLCSLVLIPFLLDLDKDFVKQRIKFVIHVYKEGNRRVAAIFPKARADQAIPELIQQQERYGKTKSIRDRPDIMKCRVKPMFEVYFPKYTGIYADAYIKKKHHNMDDTVEELVDKYTPHKKQRKEAERMANMIKVKHLREKEKLYWSDISTIMKVSVNTVQTWYRKITNDDEVLK